MKRTRSAYEKFMAMTPAERDKAVAEFDKEFVFETFGPPPPEAMAQMRRARAKPGRPRIGRGAKVISVSVEKGLLAQSDALARKLKVRRAALIARGLRAVLAEESSLSDQPLFNRRVRRERGERLRREKTALLT